MKNSIIYYVILKNNVYICNYYQKVNMDIKNINVNGEEVQVRGEWS